MLTLALADAQLTSTLGPVAAIGVACGDGRRAHAAAGAADDLRPPGLLAAPRDGRLRPGEHARHARPASGGGSATASCSGPAGAGGHRVVFVAGALGLLAYKVDYSTTTFFKKSVEAVEGFELLEQAFPAGVLAPTTMLVERDDGPVTEADLAQPRRRGRAGRRGRLGDARPANVSTDRRRSATVDVVLDGDPFTKAALDVVPEIRDASPTSARA